MPFGLQYYTTLCFFDAALPGIILYMQGCLSWSIESEIPYSVDHKNQANIMLTMMNELTFLGTF